MRARTFLGRLTIASSLLLLFLCSVLDVAHAQDRSSVPDTLSSALEREAAMLRAESAALKAELEREREQRAERVARHERRLRSLTATSEEVYLQTASQQQELGRLDALLATGTRASAGPDEALVEQALATLAERGVTPPDDLTSEQRLSWALSQAGTLLERDAAIRIERDAAFFDASGQRVEGEILHIGRVAALGRDTKEGTTGVLAPVEGETRLLQLIQPAPGAKLEDERLPVLVFDPDSPPSLAPLEEDASDEQESTFWKSIEHAGVIGWAILALGLAAALMALLKALQLFVISRRNHAIGARLIDAMHGDELDGLGKLLAENKGELSRVANQAFVHRDLPLELYEDAISAALLSELARISRGLTLIRVVAAVSPLLGLLGTVVGMIATFDALTNAGSQDAAALSSGIAQALATTQLGLMVAVPAVLLHSALVAWAERLESYVEFVVVELSIHIYEEDHHHHHHHHHGHDHDEGGEG